MTIIGTPIGSTARLGMVDLIARWRRMVDDAAGAVWDDLEAQELLDTLRTEHTGLALTPQWRLEAGVYVTRLYLVGMGNLESSASGAEAWRLYDNAGAAVSGANTNYLLGSVTFDADQAGAWRYVDCRSYDLAGAAAQGWRERMASKASSYDFEADGARYTRSQWFKHCMAMAELYEGQRPAGMGVLARSDAW
jgi:hypothetical protein